VKKSIAAGAAGLIFALGLGLGGMVIPARVVAFLDVAGHWDASLAFVMAGGLGVYALLRPLILRRSTPLLGAEFAPPPRVDRPDAKLIGGAVLFGVGWGLSGYCPGPAITALATGDGRTLLFGASMIAGAGVWELSQRVVPALRRTPALAQTPLSSCE
jgi:uncharacterized membrane protein YedE/YeeE